MDILEHKTRKAIKDHSCNFCGGRINKGEQYEYQKLVEDGELYEWKAHQHCVHLATHYDMYSYCEDDGLTQESFQEQLNDIFGNSFTTAEKAKILYSIKVKEREHLYDT